MVVHEVLPESPVRCEIRRASPTRRPFLFNPDQARTLLEAAAQLPSNPRALDRGETYKMIFALLYGLGLRVGEVSRLCRKDVDFDAKLLMIRQTKFGKDRIVPFGPRMATSDGGLPGARGVALRADCARLPGVLLLQTQADTDWDQHYQLDLP